MLISKKEIKRVNSIKFLGIFLDENLMWKDHIRVIEIKISKNLGLPYKTNKKNKCRCVKVCISLLNDCVNIAWASSTWTKLKKLARKQKQVIRITGNKCYGVRGKKSDMKILNIHKVYQHLQSSNFIFKKNKKQFHLYFKFILLRCIIYIQLDSVKIVL